MDKQDRAACIGLNFMAYRRILFFIGQDSYANCTFASVGRGSYWHPLRCLHENGAEGLIKPMDDIEIDCTVFRYRPQQTLECISARRRAKG